MYTVCSLRTYKIQHKVNTRKPLIEPQKLVFYKLFQYFIHNVSNTYQEHESTDEEREKEQHGVHRGNLQLSEGCRHHVEHQLYAYKRTEPIVKLCIIKDIVGPYKWSQSNTSWYDYYRPKSIVSLSVT